jgi:diguanylate cyclase (GGDEF)-like protein/PAS domain S-box-containing protein
VVAALENARAQFYRGATLLTAAVFAEDAVPFTDSYRQAQDVGDSSLEKARSGLIAIGETDQIAALDSFAEQMGQVREDVDAVLVFSVTADRPTRVELGLQYYPQLWPRVDAMMGDLGALSSEQQAELVAAGAAADRASDTTLTLLIGFSMFAFLGGAATLSVLVVSVVRPLASLQESARAVASGNLEARAKVAGPEEVASLARDFNEMVAQRGRAEEALRESEARYKALFAGAPEGMLVADLQTKQFRHVNPAICRMFGYTEEEFLRIGVADIHPKESLGYVLAEFEAQARGEKLLASDLPCQRKDGSLFYADVNAIMVVLDGHRCNVGFFTDVTERKQAEEALRESEERFRLAINATKDGLWEWDIRTNQEFFSPRWCEIIGYSFDDPELPHTYTSWASRIHPDDYDRVVSAMTNHLEKGTRYDVDYRHRYKSGEYRWQNSKGQAVLGESGKPIKMVGCISDITERKRAEEALREQARRDPLTGVLNHGAIVGEMRSLISTGEDATPWAVAMIDVDHLKVMNDTYGHQAGDAVLVEVAAALSQDGALVGRYGGDEFVAILRGADRAAAEGYRSKATDALAGATVTDPQTGASVRAEASIGLAVYPEDGSTLADLIKVSDSTMYAVKRQRPVRRPSPRKHAPDRKAA